MKPDSEYKQAVNILGSAWTIIEKDVKQDEYLADHYGYCDDSVRRIVVALEDSLPRKPETPEDMRCVLKRAKRHEIIHAFLFEAGLGWDSSSRPNWAINEEMVDWLSRQWPKIQAVFKEARCES